MSRRKNKTKTIIIIKNKKVNKFSAASIYIFFSSQAASMLVKFIESKHSTERQCHQDWQDFSSLIWYRSWASGRRRRARRTWRPRPPTCRLTHDTDAFDRTWFLFGTHRRWHWQLLFVGLLKLIDWLIDLRETFGGAAAGSRLHTPPPVTGTILEVRWRTGRVQEKAEMSNNLAYLRQTAVLCCGSSSVSE